MRFVSMTGLMLLTASAVADSFNQTKDFSPIINGGTPFRVTIEEVPWTGEALPTIQSAAYARYGHYLVFIGGRTSGVHDFTCSPEDNFEPKRYNRDVFVVDYHNELVHQRSLDDSDLTTTQIADLASTNKLFFHDTEHLLLVGGYGYQDEEPPPGTEWPGCPMNSTSRFLTYDTLKVLDLAGIVGWTKGDETELSQHVRFVDAPAEDTDLFAVTGGTMLLVEDEFWLCLGHRFDGGYLDEFAGCPCPTPAQQEYTKSIRRFSFDPDDPTSTPTFIGETEDPPTWARRRDLNVLPVRYGEQDRGAVALAGVFTLEVGIWSVPITIGPSGTMQQADPNETGTFKQGFNIYHSGTMSFWSEDRQENWMLVLGGMGYQVLSGGVMVEEPFIPYSNEVLAIRFDPGELLDDSDDEWSQHFPDARFPEILDGSTGLPYYFGSEMAVLPVIEHEEYIFDLDAIAEPTHVAYMYGGIASPGQNRANQTYQVTSASNRIFRVVVEPAVPCPGDIDDSGTVGVMDLLAVLDEWGCTGECIADVNNDDVVDVLDLLLVLGEWGTCTSA